MNNTCSALCLTMTLCQGLTSHIALAQQKDQGLQINSASPTAATMTNTVGAPPPLTPGHRRLYLIGYLNSDTSEANRTATVISITNQAQGPCEVSVDWFKGLDPNSAVCATVTTINAGETQEHCSRDLPGAIAVCQSTCDPNLTFEEGKAVVNLHETCFLSVDSRRLAVDARLYHTTGDADDAVSGVTGLKVVRFGQGNRGD